MSEENISVNWNLLYIVVVQGEIIVAIDYGLLILFLPFLLFFFVWESTFDLKALVLGKKEVAYWFW
jgi:hypothetical protein